EVRRVRDDRVAEARGEGEVPEALHCAAGALRMERDERGDDGQREERELLGEPPAARERPEIQEQEDARPRDEHRLREQAERERDERERVGGAASLARPARPEEEARKAEERRKDVLALDD